MKAHELLGDSSKWTQGCLARNEHGIPVEAESPTAVCWCLTGALIRCGDLSLDRLIEYTIILVYLDERAGFVMRSNGTMIPSVSTKMSICSLNNSIYEST